MELSKEKLEIYEKNLQSLQEAADELMRHMKGYDYSFRREITDRKGEFCPEKLRGLVEEMLSLWEEKLRANPYAKESWVKSYLRTRRELYGLYLYLVMRCSLCQEGYFYARGIEQKERTDFAFLLEQAKRFSRSWCMIDGPDGTSRNEPCGGYDGHFGFHLYSPINHYLTFMELNVRTLDDDWALTPPHLRAENWLYSQTAEPGETEGLEGIEEPGKTEQPEGIEEPGETEKPEGIEEPGGTEQLEEIEQPREAEQLEEIEGSGETKQPEKADEPVMTGQPEETDVSDMDSDGLFYEDWDDDYSFANAFPDPGEDDFWSPLDELDEEDRIAWWEAEYEQEGELETRNMYLLFLVQHFEGMDEYCSACRRFVELFQKAGAQISRDFCEELEEIVNLYLGQRKIAPLADMDKALDVYSRVCGGSLRLAKSYGRELQWKAL
ncbi:hypothetical protein D3Z51_07950 [Clostridiaceae bacterium]|nr:hypothetical protein [Clostridiaceae bacterium]RKI15054.1 hypothetical protein D7V81_07440 [bacterium 1XD21-70]